MNEVIVAAAIRWKDVTYSIPVPARHHTIAHSMYRAGFPMEAQREQGFVTSRGRYVDRKEGFIIAEKAGQIKPDVRIVPGTLFSENCW